MGTDSGEACFETLLGRLSLGQLPFLLAPFPLLVEERSAAVHALGVGRQDDLSARWTSTLGLPHPWYPQ